MRRQEWLAGPARMHLAIPLACAALLVTASSVARADPAVAGYPMAMAALGDSITAAWNTDAANLGPVPARSWSTGTDSAVTSHYARVLAANPAIRGGVFNDSFGGARMIDLNAQASTANTQAVDYVTILMGGNDVCTSSEATMTAVADFATRLRAALETLRTGSPSARIFVASIPDPYRLWTILHDDPNAVSIWTRYGVCQSMLANPQSTAPDDVARRDRVRQRTVDFNAQLGSICAQYVHCRFDGDAVFNTLFTVADVSPVDYFHPSTQGQATIAVATWTATFAFTDSIAPVTTASTVQASGGLAVTLAATDNVGVSGIEYRLAPGAYARYSGAVLVPFDSSITFRAVDVNGNTEASAAVVAAVAPPTLVSAGSGAAGAVPLAWSASPSAAANAVTYTVLRSPSGAGTYATVAGGIGALSYTDRPPSDGRFDYTVKAQAGASISAPSNALSALSDGTPPSSSQLAAVAGVATGSVDLSWNAASDGQGTGVSAYTVRYVQTNSCPSASPAAYPTAVSLGNVTATTVTGLLSHKPYCFYVVASDAVGNVGAPSNVATTRAR